MKNIFLVCFLIAVVVMSNCNQAKKTEDSNPQWIKELISSFEKENAHAEILQYSYNGKTVFLVSSCYQCPDAIDAVYDQEKNVLCEFGGIDGRNTCPDFGQKATGKKIVWRNKNLEY